jgi:hypothetical protein
MARAESAQAGIAWDQMRIRSVSKGLTLAVSAVGWGRLALSALQPSPFPRTIASPMRPSRFAPRSLALRLILLGGTGLLPWVSLSGNLMQAARANDDPPPENAPAEGSPPPAVDRLPPDAELKRELLPPPPLVDGKRKRVYIIEDRFNECGGTVEAETDDWIVIESKGKLRGFYKARVTEIIPLIEPKPNQPGIVLMRNGVEYRGVIVRDEVDEVEVNIEGIRQVLPRSSVARVILTLTPRETYERVRHEIKPDQFSDRLRMCRYLYDNKLYSEAREELVSLLEAVDMFEAKELLRTVEAQLALTPVKEGAENGESGLLDENTPDDEQPLKGQPPAPTRILTPEDVNIIKVYEIDFRKPPRVAFSQELIKEMIERYSASSLIPATAEGRAALYRAEPERLVRLLFDLRARELYPKVQVLGEPESLSLFRRRVHNSWLINNCATSQCHGGMQGGRFFLHRRNAESPQVRYTNLLLLERTKLEGRPPLIDWQRPRDSLVVQFALPRAEARYPHPDVKGWRAAFGASGKRLMEDFVRWVESMYQPRPEYPVELSPPDLSAPDRSTPVDAPVVPR